MSGVSSEYEVDPVDEYIIGAPIGANSYRLHRGRRSYVVRPGQFVVLDPERAHRGTQTDDGPWDGRMLALPAALLLSTLDEPPHLLRAGIGAPVVDDEALRQRFVDLHRSSEAGSSRLQRECAMISLLDDLVPSAGGRLRPEREPAVTIAVTYLRDCFLDTVTLDALAHATSTDKFRLVRAFRRELGVTPHQFLVSIRVANARRLLAVGAAPVDAAAESGFADQSHLSRHFRDRLGITPGRYRRLATS